MSQRRRQLLIRRIARAVLIVGEIVGESTGALGDIAHVRVLLIGRIAMVVVAPASLGAVTGGILETSLGLG